MNKLFKNTGIFLLCSLVACSTCLVSGTRAEAGQPSALSTVQDSKGGADNKTAPLTLDIQSEGSGEGSTEDTETLNRIVLSVGDGQKTPVYKAGTKTELKINITNKGNVDAQNVTITPVIGKTEEKKAKEIETQIRMRAEIEEKIRLEKMRAEKIENAVKDRMRINE